MKTLRNFVVTGGLLRSNGDQAQVGDSVRLYPYEGEPFIAEIVAVATVNCGNDRAYAIEYDLDAVLRICDLEDRGDVLDCCEILQDQIDAINASALTLEVDGDVATISVEGGPSVEVPNISDRPGIIALIETKTSSGDYASGNFDGRLVINTADGSFKIYAQSSWHDIASWGA